MHTLTLYPLTNVHYRIDLAGRVRILFDSINAYDPNDSPNKRIVCLIPGQ